MHETPKIVAIAAMALLGGSVGFYFARFQRPNNPWTKRWAANHPETVAKWQLPHMSNGKR